MRRLMSVALIGLALASTTTVVAAQGRGRGQAQAGRAGVRGGAGRARGAGFDSARVRRMDSVRVARGDTARRRPGMDSPRGRGRGGRPGDVMSGRAGLAGVNLTEDQKTRVKAINKKYGDELKELRKANGNDGVGQNAELRAKIQGIAERERDEIRGVLTAEQRVQFDANLAKHRGGRGKPPGEFRQRTK